MRTAVNQLLRGPLGDAFESLAGSDGVLWEVAAVISTRGAGPQILHGDTVFAQTPSVYTAFVALQDVERYHGPTRFVPGTHSGAVGEAAHARLAADDSSKDSGGDQKNGDGDSVDAGEVGDGAASPSQSPSPPHAFCSSADTVVALLRAGEVTLYDSRLLHCGGPNLGMDDTIPTNVERVLFALSFVVAGAGDADNVDAHGAGSILPELAARRLTLGEMRQRAERTRL